MLLTYWVARIKNDSESLSLRAKTKKECIEMLNSVDDPNDFEEPKKVTIQYDNGFDLMQQCLGEYGVGE